MFGPVMNALGMIDDSKNIQVFSAKGCQEFEFLNIRMILPRLGKGGQAEVWACEIDQVPGKYVDKYCGFFDNPEKADDKLRKMLAEFVIAKDLQHPNIVSYKYLMKHNDPDRK